MRLCLFASIAASLTAIGAQQTPLHKPSPSIQTLPSLREQAALINSWVAKRKKFIPQILRSNKAEAWLISMLEHGEDPVFWLLKSAEQFSARRRTIYLFLADDSGDRPFEYSWIDNTPQVWTDLAKVIEERNITKLVANIDPKIAFSSGLHHGEANEILKSLEKVSPGQISWTDRLVNVPDVANRFVALQIDDRLPWYRKLQESAWAIIQDAFSEKVITPGTTTTTDVEWWMMDKLQLHNFTTWFKPDVSILNSQDYVPGDPEVPDRIINYGDVLHADFGVTALGMNTDTQHLGYVLHPGQTEEDIPAGLVDGLRKGNRLQDIVRQNMLPDRTGNQILKAARDQMHAEGIQGRIYCHGVGDFGHSGGTAIGMTNLQDFVPGLGEADLGTRTWMSVELYAEHFVPELGETLIFPLEEDVAWDDKNRTFEWVYGRQERFHLVHAPAKVPVLEDL